MHSQHISVDTLSTAMISRLRDDLSISDRLQFRVLRTADNSDTTIQSLRKSIDRAKKKLDRLTDAYLNSAINLEDFKRLRIPLDDEIATAQAALLEYDPLKTEEDTSGALKDAILSTVLTLESDASVAKKYDALNAIIDHCTFDKEKSILSITYRISV